jgi:hypothetical protein
MSNNYKHQRYLHLLRIVVILIDKIAHFSQRINIVIALAKKEK